VLLNAYLPEVLQSVRIAETDVKISGGRRVSVRWKSNEGRECEVKETYSEVAG